MRIFIIGGTGFISKNIVEVLLERGHYVTIFTRGKSFNPFEQNEYLHIKTGDRNNDSDLRSALGNEDFDVVYDMTAYKPEQSEAVVKILGGRTGRFVHCSTVSVYMVSDDIQCPVTEDQDKRKLMDYFPRNPFGMEYGINKRKCEDVLWAAQDAGDLRVTMLRPVFVSGPEDRTGRDFFWIQRILDDKPLLVPGSGDFAFQQVYVKDTARAFCDIIDTDVTIGEAYNVASEEVYSLNEYIGMIAQILNKTPELIHIDQEAFDKLDISYYPGADVFPFNTRRTAVFSLDKIKNHTGFKSTQFKYWMPLTVDWFVKNVKESFGYTNRGEEVEIACKWKKVIETAVHEFKN